MNDEVLPRRRGPLFWWDAGVVALMLLQTVLGTLEGAAGAPYWAPEALRLPLVLLPLALFVLLYILLGRATLLRGMRDEPLGAPGTAYLTLLVALLAFAVLCSPLHAMLQALVYPIVWTVCVRYRDAVLWSAAAALLLGVGMFSGIAVEDVESAWQSAAITAPISFAFAVVMGTWIRRIFEQGERQRVLVDELRRSQAEVAALSTEAGASAERERLSRELHDTLTQTLAGLVMLSEQADRALAEGDGVKARDRLARVREASRTAVEEARALVAATQPLGDGGLEQTIERVAGRMSADTGVRVVCDLSTLELDRERQVVLLRAAQEGLANARKHARASSVAVRLRRVPDSAPGLAELTVEDDGVGLEGSGVGDDGEESDVGFGLSGLRDRVRFAGGEFRIGESDSGGVRLEVRLPMEPRRTGGDR